LDLKIEVVNGSLVQGMREYFGSRPDQGGDECDCGGMRRDEKVMRTAPVVLVLEVEVSNKSERQLKKILMFVDFVFLLGGWDRIKGKGVLDSLLN
jgi:hypothetical protein